MSGRTITVPSPCCGEQCQPHKRTVYHPWAEHVAEWRESLERRQEDAAIRVECPTTRWHCAHSLAMAARRGGLRASRDGFAVVLTLERV